MSYFHVFECKCYILNERANLGKFDSRTDEGIFIGYFSNSCAFRIYNMCYEKVLESINVVFSGVEDFSEYSQECEI